MGNTLSNLCYIGSLTLVLLGSWHLIYVFAKYKFKFYNFNMMLGDLSPTLMAYAAALRGLEVSGFVPSLHDWRNTINLLTAVGVIMVCWFGLRYGRWSRFAKH